MRPKLMMFPPEAMALGLPPAADFEASIDARAALQRPADDANPYAQRERACGGADEDEGPGRHAEVS